ncbi:unnamed protein product [Durusdinium trenchii]|uniref:Uncharacterized protein n=1 Tax=Durusdinium trenchii TaxID=1381693 RepID=A0ABP0HE40_9DINO
MKDLESFERLARQRLVHGVQQDSLEEALAFVRALCEGMNAFENSSRVTSDGALVVRSSSPLFGEFATRSRIPFNLVNEEEVSFQVSYTPPSGDCPFRCSCHARCFGPASCSHEGQPTGGPWAEVTVDFPNQKGLRLPAAAQVFANHVTWAELCGKRVVHVPKNDVSSVDLKGGIAILAEKFKPGTTSDGAILREAYQAGAVAVIKIGGGGAMLYSVPDPTEIPCFAISEADGKVLCDALANTAPGLLPKVREMKLLDQREALHSERWGAGKVWVMLSGLYLQSVDWENPLSEVAEEANASKGALIYEDYFEVYESSRSVDPRLSLEKSKLRRMMESAWSQLGRVGLASNASMMGKLLALGAQRCKLRMDYVKFFPAETFSGTACTMLLSPHKPGLRQKPASDMLVQAWVAHEAVYLALMGHFTKLIDYMAPSLWNFIKCINGEFFGWEADSKKIRKLFTACTGPVGPVPRELLKQQDPTWRIVDERNAIGLQVRSQGRLLWREAEGPSRAHQAQGPREAEAPGSSLRDFMGRMAQMICCC